MGLFSKAEFAEACGISTRELSVYISRNKVVVIDDVIDSDVSHNADFLRKKKEKKADGNNGRGSAKTAKSKVPAAKRMTPAELKKAKERAEGVYILDKEKKKLDTEKVRHENALLEIRQKKLTGELIPTGLIKTLFISHTESIKNAYSDASENLIVIIAQQKGLDAKEVSEMRKQLSKIINSAIDMAVDNTKRTLDNLIVEYSKTRSVGQHG